MITECLAGEKLWARAAQTFYDKLGALLLQEKNVYSVLDVDVRHHARLSFLMDALVFGQLVLQTSNGKPRTDGRFELELSCSLLTFIL